MRREVLEETGLTLTKIWGEETAVYTQIGAVTTLSFTSFCTTQNLSGAYSIILHTFLCEAEGSLSPKTNETENVHWVKTTEIAQLLHDTPEKIFFMHINSLKQYLHL